MSSLQGPASYAASSRSRFAITLPNITAAPCTSSLGTSGNSAVHSHHAAVQVERPQVLLATACTTLVTSNGEDSSAAGPGIRNLADPGIVGPSPSITSLSSFRAYCKRRCSKGCFNSRSRRSSSSITHRSVEVHVSVFVLPSVTSRIPAQRVEITSWSHLVNLPLADPGFAVLGAIDILLGADVYGSLLHRNLLQGPSNAPVAQETCFGWIISRPIGSSASSSHPTSFSIRPTKRLRSSRGFIKILVSRRNPVVIVQASHFGRAGVQKTFSRNSFLRYLGYRQICRSLAVSVNSPAARRLQINSFSPSYDSD